jgi:hypothetical protein
MSRITGTLVPFRIPWTGFDSPLTKGLGFLEWVVMISIADNLTSEDWARIDFPTRAYMYTRSNGWEGLETVRNNHELRSSARTAQGIRMYLCPETSKHNGQRVSATGPSCPERASVVDTHPFARLGNEDSSGRVEESHTRPEERTALSVRPRRWGAEYSPIVQL